ncbi:MAG: hypothetical protein ACK5D7_10400 [Planctomycetota bacterium]|jgi:hypothetical protein
MARNSIRQSRRRRLGPIGTVAAMCTASAVTLVGVMLGLEPHVILLRAAGSAILMGSVLTFGLSVIQMANTPPAKGNRQ